MRYSNDLLAPHVTDFGLPCQLPHHSQLIISSSFQTMSRKTWKVYVLRARQYTVVFWVEHKFGQYLTLVFSDFALFSSMQGLWRCNSSHNSFAPPAIRSAAGPEPHVFLLHLSYGPNVPRTSLDHQLCRRGRRWVSMTVFFWIPFALQFWKKFLNHSVDSVTRLGLETLSGCWEESILFRKFRRFQYCLPYIIQFLWYFNVVSLVC